MNALGNKLLKWFITSSMFVLFVVTGLQGQERYNIREHYDKTEVMAPMRDGVKLFTQVYTPKDKSQTCPVMLFRTPYSIGNYGEDNYKIYLGPGRHFAPEGYIFVYQDVRGKFKSEGEFVPDEVTPIEYDLRDKYHCFQKGHRIMVQIQSTWFPVIDRNPQKFVDIYHAAESNFQKATHKVFRSGKYASHLKLRVLQ